MASKVIVNIHSEGVGITLQELFLLLLSEYSLLFFGVIGNLALWDSQCNYLAEKVSR